MNRSNEPVAGNHNDAAFRGAETKQRRAEANSNRDFLQICKSLTRGKIPLEIINETELKRTPLVAVLVVGRGPNSQSEKSSSQGLPLNRSSPLPSNGAAAMTLFHEASSSSPGDARQRDAADHPSNLVVARSLAASETAHVSGLSERRTSIFFLIHATTANSHLKFAINRSRAAAPIKTTRPSISRVVVTKQRHRETNSMLITDKMLCRLRCLLASTWSFAKRVDE